VSAFFFCNNADSLAPFDAPRSPSVDRRDSSAVLLTAAEAALVWILAATLVGGTGAVFSPNS